MIKESIQAISDREKLISDAVKAKCLHDAFVGLRRHAASLGDWKITEQIDTLEQSYSMMLAYAVGGQPDPQRDELYDSITSGILKLMDVVSYRLAIENRPDLFYSTFRYEQLQTGDSIGSMLDEYRDTVQYQSLYNMLGTAANGDSNENILKSENIGRRIFNRIWTTYPFSVDDMNAVSSIFGSSSPFPLNFQLHMVSALVLSLIHFYDQRKVDMLLDIYQNGQSPQLAVQALCGALTGIYLHRDRYSRSYMKKRVDTLRDITSWQSDVRMISMQLIRTRDTERIHRKLADEIMPQMLKLSPDIARRLSDKTSISDITSMEDNPEWEELLEKSGVADSLKELMQLQEEGGDIMMATFSNLKSFPFFNDAANWFVPFRADHPAVSGNGGEDMKKIASLLESMNVFCDGDKYSFALMLLSMPEEQRKMMSAQLDQQHVAAMEMRNASLQTGPALRQQIANLYIQQLYRFFKLFRRRGEFNDPFARPVSLAALDLLAPDLSHPDTLRLVGEFYFKRGYYADALQIFKQLSEKGALEAASLQKMGVCQQRLGNTSDALQTYLKAELMCPDSLWTMRRIASCHRMLGNIKSALEYYKRIEEHRPNDIELALNIGHCLLETGEYKEALKYYFKVEYLSPESHKAIRPIAWCSFVMGQYEQSGKYYERIMLDNPAHSDYLNMGHLNMALNDIREALNCYALALEQPGVEKEDFISDLQSDYVWLERAGVDLSVMPLIIDAILYGKIDKI
ncbi:lipopolysaccharide assembly protein LapB [uncultured Muribaculum sp.]|uniref:tetratricopeptide repeat protein n=1 Tax=uncultured Muribaculum sp. TaxID=1918613 RepID=UPI0025B75514|nr:tetratricopeptide repeat protein [uncultured Muribaculum sp.]